MEGRGALELIRRHIDHAMVRIGSASGHVSTPIGNGVVGSYARRAAARPGPGAISPFGAVLPIVDVVAPGAPAPPIGVVGGGCVHRGRHRLVGELDLVIRDSHVLFTNP